MSKKILFSGLVVLIVVLILIWRSGYILNSHSDEWQCLQEGETVEYKENKKTEEVSTATIIVKDGNEEKYSFEIELPRPNHYHPIELHECGVYAMRFFNYDPKKTRQELGYRSELWKYDYSGKGKSLILLAEKPDEYISYYSSDFRVDFLERYVVLEKGHSGKEYYALVIKNLETKEDVFVLGYREMMKKYPELLGGFGMKEWTQDGRYFYGNIFYAANVSAYFRIDTETWTYEIFDVPENQMGGDQLSVETGWVTNHTGTFWTGEYSSTMDIEAKMRSQGIGTKFYLYNLLTKEKILVYETDEPNRFTKPRWLLEKEVEYELPSGEKRVYELE